MSWERRQYDETSENEKIYYPVASTAPMEQEFGGQTVYPNGVSGEKGIGRSAVLHLAC
jgi:hypothetical protein